MRTRTAEERIARAHVRRERRRERRIAHWQNTIAELRRDLAARQAIAAEQARAEGEQQPC